MKFIAQQILVNLDALEITMSAIEENVEEQFHCHKFNAQIYNKALEHMIVYYEYVPIL